MCAEISKDEVMSVISKVNMKNNIFEACKLVKTLIKPYSGE